MPLLDEYTCVVDGFDNLLPNTDMPLLDEYTCVVDGFGKSQLEHLGLKATLKKVFSLQAENIIKLHLVLSKHPNTNKATQKCISFKQTFRIFILQGQKLSCSSSDLGQAVLDTPYLFLAPESILSDKLQLLVKASLLEGSPWSGVNLPILCWDLIVDHAEALLAASLVEVNQAILAW